MIMTVVAVVSWLLAVKIFAYTNERSARIEAVNQLIWQVKETPVNRFRSMRQFVQNVWQI